MANPHDGNPQADDAMDGIAVSPPAPDPDAHAVPEIREGIDAETERKLKADPSDPDAKLDVGLEETFPSSDAPATTRPGSTDPAPSTGFDAEEERRLAEERGD